MPEFPNEVTALLRVASEKSKKAQKRFVCRAFKSDWNQFVEEWASRSYVFVSNAFGGFQKEPLPEIIAMHDGAHSGGANASFDPGTGRITLSSVMDGNPGCTLEKITHELTHAALAGFPDDDGFYTEGTVDYSVWVMAHAPAWEPYRNQMIEAAAFNIQVRRDRALKAGSDWDRKRWAGGLHAHMAYGPHVIPRLRQKKLEGDFTW